MDRQYVFNFVTGHLRKQGRPAEVDHRCVFVAPDGARCAVGCMLPKGVTVPKGTALEDVIALYDIPFPDLMIDLAGVHDDAPIDMSGDFRSEDLKECLRNVAVDHDLIMPRE